MHWDATLQEYVKQSRVHACAAGASEIVECDVCRALTQQKACVLHSNTSKDALLEKPFVSAVCIFSFNDPQCHTIMLRVKDYAGRKINVSLGIFHMTSFFGRS